MHWRKLIIYYAIIAVVTPDMDPSLLDNVLLHQNAENLNLFILKFPAIAPPPAMNRADKPISWCRQKKLSHTGMRNRLRLPGSKLERPGDMAVVCKWWCGDYPKSFIHMTPLDPPM